MAVVFAAAVFAPQAVAAQDALLAVRLVSQLERVRGVPRAAQLVAQAALLVPDELLAVRLDASPVVRSDA